MTGNNTTGTPTPRAKCPHATPHYSQCPACQQLVFPLPDVEGDVDGSLKKADEVAAWYLRNAKESFDSADQNLMILAKAYRALRSLLKRVELGHSFARGIRDGVIHNGSGDWPMCDNCGFAISPELMGSACPARGKRETAHTPILKEVRGALSRMKGDADVGAEGAIDDMRIIERAIKGYHLDAGLAALALDAEKQLLESCENALAERTEELTRAREALRKMMIAFPERKGIHGGVEQETHNAATAALSTNDGGGG